MLTPPMAPLTRGQIEFAEAVYQAWYETGNIDRYPANADEAFKLRGRVIELVPHLDKNRFTKNNLWQQFRQEHKYQPDVDHVAVERALAWDWSAIDQLTHREWGVFLNELASRRYPTGYGIDAEVMDPDVAAAYTRGPVEARERLSNLLTTRWRRAGRPAEVRQGRGINYLAHHHETPRECDQCRVLATGVMRESGDVTRYAKKLAANPLRFSPTVLAGMRETLESKKAELERHEAGHDRSKKVAA